MKQTLFERIITSWKSSLVGLALIGGGLYAAIESRIGPNEKALLVMALVTGGLVLLGVKDPRRPQRRTPKRPR